MQISYNYNIEINYFSQYTLVTNVQALAVM